MKIYLTRHGQTVWNIDKRLQGCKNSDLTELGIKQAKLLSEKMKDEKIDYIYSSPIERAYKTAEIIKGTRNLQIETIDALKEIAFGEWEGLTLDEVAANPIYNKELENLFQNPEKYRPFGGETPFELLDRSHRALKSIINKHKNKDENILIVTHGMTLKMIISYFKQNLTSMEIMQLPVYGQTSITEIQFNGDEFNIIRENDISHYEEGFEIKGW